MSDSNYANKHFIVSLNIADIVTIVGLVLGLLAIKSMLLQRFDVAMSLLLLAMAIDFIDGSLARRYGLARDFGRYLDSFVDVIDYLIAPALFLYLRGFDAGWQQALLCIFIVSGLVRLSVFNELGNISTQSGQRAYIGMPVFWSVVGLSGFQFFSWFITLKILFPITAILATAQAIAMVSNAHFVKFTKIPTLCLVISVVSVGFLWRGVSE